MDKRVILAVAGAGKTYYICNAIDPKKRNLIIAYTNENIKNIRNELIKAHGAVPELTTVTTFDSFVYHSIILPYEPSISAYFSEPSFISKGITMSDPPPQQIQVRGRSFRNCKYISQKYLGHYITKSAQYYCANLSELVMQVKKEYKLSRRASLRLNQLYDAVYIDEFQDFRKYDYDLIITLAKKLPNIMLVGDFYQHSVSGKNNHGKPYAKSNNIQIDYDAFIRELERYGFSIDNKSLEKSRRCSSDVCKFVREKLQISISSYDDHEGSVRWINENPENIIENNNIVKLVYRSSKDYKFRALNWSYSKGDTFDEACVILTDKFDNLDSETFDVSTIAPSTINRLYVAMTRSRGILYLIKASIFDTIKGKNFKKVSAVSYDDKITRLRYMLLRKRLTSTPTS